MYPTTYQKVTVTDGRLTQGNQCDTDGMKPFVAGRSSSGSSMLMNSRRRVPEQLKGCEYGPRVLFTDTIGSYEAAKKEVMLNAFSQLMAQSETILARNGIA